MNNKFKFEIIEPETTNPETKKIMDELVEKLTESINETTGNNKIKE